eukprot:3068529-Prymnesium_polylepis.1
MTEGERTQAGMFDCTCGVWDPRLGTHRSAITVGSTACSCRHINLSGKTDREGQMFEHLLREVFKRV